MGTTHYAFWTQPNVESA